MYDNITTTVIVLLSLNSVFTFIIYLKQKTMATFQDLQDVAASLQASVDAKQKTIAEAIAALEAKITAGALVTPEQLQTVVDSLKSTQADIESTPLA